MADPVKIKYLLHKRRHFCLRFFYPQGVDPMPYATKAQIERARQPDLLTFLRRYKPDESL